MIRIDPTIPVRRQPTMTVHRPAGPNCWERGELHEWFSHFNGVECPRCDTLLVALSGRIGYRGHHRANQRKEAMNR